MIGEIVKDFSAIDQDGNKFRLYDILGKGLKVLLIFYPRDNSPVCTKQLSDYQANKNYFAGRNIFLLGVNIAGGSSHKNFCTQSKIDFPILIDESKHISKQFNALNFLGSNKRKLILIGTDKKIVFERTVFALTYLSSDEIFHALSGH